MGLFNLCDNPPTLHESCQRRGRAEYGDFAGKWGGRGAGRRARLSDPEQSGLKVGSITGAREALYRPHRQTTPASAANPSNSTSRPMAMKVTSVSIFLHSASTKNRLEAFPKSRPTCP